MTSPGVNTELITRLNDTMGELQAWVRALLDTLIDGDQEAMKRARAMTELLEGIIDGLNRIVNYQREFKEKLEAEEAVKVSLLDQQVRLTEALKALDARLARWEATSGRLERQIAELTHLLR